MAWQDVRCDIFDGYINIYGHVKMAVLCLASAVFIKLGHVILNGFCVIIPQRGIVLDALPWRLKTTLENTTSI